MGTEGYLTAGGRGAGLAARRFADRLDGAGAWLVAAGREAAADAAAQAVADLGRVAESVYPLPARPAPAMALNPEAGNHPVPEDPRAVEAALRAGARTWGRFPYYERRYGGRGRAYTRSDSAYLATLCDLPAASARRQVLWLADLLASRGMPRWLMEETLRDLRAELDAAVPERAADHAVLGELADELRAARLSHMTDAEADALAASFAAAAGPELVADLPEAGRLIAAAVADERAGIAHAGVRLESWLADPARFPDTWTAAVRDALRRARLGLRAPGRNGGREAR
jgi:hypothetical protein